MNNVTQKANEIYESILKESKDFSEPWVFIKRSDIGYNIPIFIVSDSNMLSIGETIWDDFEIFTVFKKIDITAFLSAMIIMHCQDRHPSFDIMKINNKISHEFQVGPVENITEEIEEIVKCNKKHCRHLKISDGENDFTPEQIKEQWQSLAEIYNKEESPCKVFTPVFGLAPGNEKRENIYSPLDLLEVDYIKKIAEGKNFYKFAYNENGEIFALHNEGYSWQVIGNIDFTKEEFEQIGIHGWEGEKYKVGVVGVEAEIDKDHIVKTNKAFMAMLRAEGCTINCKFSCGDYTLDDMQNMNTGETTVLMDNAIKLKENYEKE